MTQCDDVNAAGEPAVIYLQLHGDGKRNDTKPDDYRNGDISWCWERIHEQDVQYVRSDLAGTPARIPGAPTTEGYYWYRQDTWATIHNVHPGRGANWGKLIVETGAVTHTGNHIKRTPVGEMPGEWFGPLLPPPPSKLRIDPVEALLASTPSSSGCGGNISSFSSEVSAMLVRDLIAALQKLDPELPVVAETSGYGQWHKATEIRTIRIVRIGDDDHPAPYASGGKPLGKWFEAVEIV